MLTILYICTTTVYSGGADVKLVMGKFFHYEVNVGHAYRVINRTE